MSIWLRLKSNVVKWWQLTVMPVFRLDNNNTFFDELNVNSSVAPPSFPVQNGQATSDSTNLASNHVRQQDNTTIGEASLVQTSSCMQPKAEPESSDAQAVMDRINREREEKRLDDLKKAQRKAEEQARLDAIMNANKVDVNAFIEAGKEAQHEEERKKTEDDALAKANEIIARLNREAAEDEAKKQAEIEAAKKKAQETFGN